MNEGQQRRSHQRRAAGTGQSEETCLNTALRYLGYRDRSEAELRQYLKRRGFDQQKVEHALSQLREKGLANDSAFARSWVENRASFSPRGKALLRGELRAKGIDTETIAEVVESVDDGSSAYRAGLKKAKLLSSCDYEVFRNKLSGFLRRRGFSHEVSQGTVNQLWQEQAEGRHDA